MFIINSLIDIVKSSKKILHCCFFDFKQAFDRVSRERLWEKLEQHRINGKCLRLIQNMYQNIKSNVHANNQSSAYFPCYSGVRQGENLSPFLFTIFINDLRSFLDRYVFRGVDCYINYEEITSYFKILILLFADDTVLFADSELELQHAISVFQDYCSTMKLTVNVSKTKIIIFTNARNSNHINFMFNLQPIEIVSEYKYLGIYFSKMVPLH